MIDSNQLERYETLMTQNITDIQQTIEREQHKTQQEKEEFQKRLDLSNNNKSAQRKYRGKVEKRQLEFRNLQRLQTVLEQESNMIRQQFEEQRHRILQQDINEQSGLTPERIQKLQKFLADESLVGQHCGVCLDDIEVGRRMMRLDCDGQHIFCQKCCEKWFADKKTCPNCRKVL